MVFFSLSGTKEDLYILPIVPAEAALIGAMIAESDRRDAIVNARSRWSFIAAGVAAVGAGCSDALGLRHRRSAIRWTAPSFIGVAAIGGGAGRRSSPRLRRRLFAAASCRGCAR